MVIVLPKTYLPDSTQQAPVGLEALQLLRNSIEEYEDWKCSLKKQKLKSAPLNEIVQSKENSRKNTNRSVSKRPVYPVFHRPEDLRGTRSDEQAVSALGKYTARNKHVAKPFGNNQNRASYNRVSENNISVSTGKDIPRTPKGFVISKSATKIRRRRKKKPIPPSEIKGFDIKNVTEKSSEHSSKDLKSNSNDKSKKSTEGRLCRDATFTNPFLYKCKVRKTKENIVEEYESASLTPEYPDGVEVPDEVKIKYRIAQRRVPTKAQIIESLRKSGLTGEQIKDMNIIDPVPVVTGPVYEPVSNPDAKILKLPFTCERMDLKELLDLCHYTNSEMDILLDDLRSFPNVKEAADKFEEYFLSKGKHSKASSAGEEDKASPGKEARTDTGEEVKQWEQEEDYEEDEDTIEIGASSYEGAKEVMYSGEEDVDEETDQSEAKQLDAPAEGKPMVVTEEEAVPATSERLIGILYKAMTRYYNSRAEGLMSIKEYVDEGNKQEFHDILLGAIQEQGVPSSEEALRTFLSNITGVKTSAKGQGISHSEVASYYESAYLKKIAQGEKYFTRKTACLAEMFAQKYPVDRDLFELLSPYLQEIQTEVKESQIKKKMVKRKKKKKHKEVIEEETGPFNIILRSGVRNKVWRSALKKIKKKTEVLRKVIDYKQKSAFQYDTYHQHFSEYFKKKRNEIKRIRRNRKTPVSLKLIHLNLSEAESTSSFSSGDFYPEKELMSSILHDYCEKSEFPVPTLERKTKKISKREKLKKEKLFQRSGGEAGLRGILNTPLMEKTWPEKAQKKKFKRRARVVEEYLYSSGDEITGLEAPPKKDEKQATIKDLADQLLKPEVVNQEESQRLEQPKKSEVMGEEFRDDKEGGDLLYNFFIVCSKHKMMLVYYLLTQYNILKPPLDEKFMKSTITLSDSLEPFELTATPYRKVAKKFFKLGVRTIFGIYYMEQKQKNILTITDPQKKEASGNCLQSKISDNADNIELYSEKNIKDLLSNATIQRERHMKWMRSYCGIKDTIRTQEMMSLYFGPVDEPWVNIEPIEKRKKSLKGRMKSSF